MISVLAQLKQAIIDGDLTHARALTHQGLEDGLKPLDIFTEAITPAMDEVGRRMAAGEYFLPEVIVCAKAASEASEILKPLITDDRRMRPAGTVVLGTVEGDLHSIGKNLVAMLMEGTGFRVIDLGVNVPVKGFVSAVKEYRPDIVGMSALLTTTMLKMRDIIEALQEAGLRHSVRIMVGGAPLTQQFADSIGADGYFPDAPAAVSGAKEWMTAPITHRLDVSPKPQVSTVVLATQRTPEKPLPKPLVSPVSTGPDFERLRRALLRQGEPDRVPIFESIDPVHKNTFLGHPEREQRPLSLEDNVRFYAEAGYDYVELAAGLGKSEVIRKDFATRRASYTLFAGREEEREWAAEGEGLITSLRDFESFPWPEPEELDYSHFEEVTRYLPSKMKVLAELGKIFTGVWWLMGMERFCEALVLEPDLVARMFDRVGEIQIKVLEIMLSFDCVGAVIHSDDLAYAEQLLIGPEYLRQYVFPWFKILADMCKAHNVPCIFHSDGNVWDVMDDIVACGFDALNPIEPKAMDILEVKRKYGDKLCLIGNVGVDYPLARGTPQEVETEVKRLIKQLAPGGGYALASSNSIPDYVPFENFMALREAGLRYGTYPITIPD